MALSPAWGDRALYDKVVRSFRSDALEQFQALEHAVQHAVWSDGLRYAHTLKGLAATVGAVALAQHAAAVETDLKAVEFSGPMAPAVQRLYWPPWGMHLSALCRRCNNVCPMVPLFQLLSVRPLCWSGLNANSWRSL